MQRELSVCGDLIELLLRGGLVVETTGGPENLDAILVSSTIHLDGDITTYAARPILGQTASLGAHFSGVEERIGKVELLVGRGVWAVRGFLWLVVPGVALYLLADGEAPKEHIWISVGLSFVPTVIVEIFFNTHKGRNLLLSSAFALLSRLAGQWR